MPSITAYTPFETLKFCQSIAQHGADASSFEEIAASLNANELIRESQTYDQGRLSAAALHDLYDNLLARERDGSPKVNGDAAEEQVNPRKRKLSRSPESPSGDQARSEEDLINALVEKLYTRFRQEVIKEIKDDEEECDKLQKEIQELQTKEDSTSAIEATQAAQVAITTQHKRQPSRTDVSSLLSPHDETPAYSKQGLEERLQEQSSSRPSSSNDGRPQHAPTLPPPIVPSQHSPGTTSSRPSAEPAQQPPPNLGQSPAAFNRTLPPPSPQRPGFAPPPHHGFAPGPQGHPVPILPPPPGIPQHMPPPMEYVNQKRSSSTSTPARGSPVPPPQQSYPGYPPYQQQPPPWPHQYPPPQHAYPQHMQYPNQPYYAQSPVGRPPYQTPHHSPYPPYHPAPPGHYGPPPQGWHPSPQRQPYSQPVSAVTTPITQAAHRRSVVRSSGSSTPWKRTPLRPGQPRPSSPTRPERDVSPLTDTEDTPGKQAVVDDLGSKRSSRGRGRPPSSTPSGVQGSRSHSIASHKSETPSAQPSTARRTQAIKDETPSTPIASSDIDKTRSTRRGRPRNTTATTTSTPRPSVDLSRANTVQKRKRSPPTALASSVTPPPVVASVPATNKAPHNNPIYTHEPDLVLVSKTFAKTSQLVLNEITSHKLAGIFAKPLSERDAPGYKDLVLRPTDLKTIRAAVSRGSRAALATIEALESTDNDDQVSETPTKARGLKLESISTVASDHDLMTAKEGPLGSTGMYLVKKTEELIPPKGIVNSAQLEMELTRMFANAVMFNPLLGRERGFGRSLRLRRLGGDLVAKIQRERKGKGKSGDEGDEGDEGSDGGSEDGDGKRSGDTASEGDSESSTTEGSSSGSEGGGIIGDAREMFDDVVAAVGRWREVEVERITGASVSGSGNLNVIAGAEAAMGREGSVSIQSVSSVLHQGDEDEGVGGTGTVGTGSGAGAMDGEGEGRGGRKRRRINE